MVQSSYYDPAERRREKDRSRERDDRALRNGSIGRDELRAQNGFLASLDVISSSVRRRGISG